VTGYATVISRVFKFLLADDPEVGNSGREWSDGGPQRSHWRFAALVGWNTPPQTAARALRAWCSALQN